jgi:hypothetical protein
MALWFLVLLNQRTSVKVGRCLNVCVYLGFNFVQNSTKDALMPKWSLMEGTPGGASCDAAVHGRGVEGLGRLVAEHRVAAVVGQPAHIQLRHFGLKWNLHFLDKTFILKFDTS